MKKVPLLFAFVLVIAAPAWAKNGKPPPQDFGGWCCVHCEVEPLAKDACTGKGGTFFTIKVQAEKSCAAQKGWCCDEGNLLEVKRSDCTLKKGVFFCEKKEALEKCTAPKEAKSPTKLPKSPVPAVKTAPVLAPPQIAQGWCYVSGDLVQLTADQCGKRKGVFFSTKKEGIAHKFSQQKKVGVAQPAQPKVLKIQPPEMKEAGRKEDGMKAGPVTFGGRVPRAGAPPEGPSAGEPGIGMARAPGPAAASPSRAGAAASSLVPRIRIISPNGDDVLDWGDTITVRYQVTLINEEPGDISFTFRGPDRRAIAETTHYYEAPTLESLGEIESLEPAAPEGGLYTLPGGDEEEPVAGHGSFEWTLPATGGGTLNGHGFTIAASKGPHRGVSEEFTMMAECTRGDMSVAIEPPQAVLRQGQAVTIVFAFCGFAGLPESDPVYIHPARSSSSEVGTWTMPRHTVTELSEDRVRGALRVTVPGGYAIGEGHVFSLRYGVGGFIRTPAFEVAGPVGRDDVELTDLFRNSAGDIVARVWAGSSMGGTPLPVEVNGVTRSWTVEAGENDLVVGSQPYREGPVGVYIFPDEPCSDLWEVALDPDDAIAESRENNNRLSRKFSHYERAGLVYLADGTRSSFESRIPCECAEGRDPWGDCHTILFLKNCSEETVNLFGTITVRQRGTRDRGGGSLGTESFDEEVPFGLFIGPSRERSLLLPLDEFASIRVEYEDYGGYLDSALIFSFGPPLSGWWGMTNPAEVYLNFGEMEMGAGCVY